MIKLRAQRCITLLHNRRREREDTSVPPDLVLLSCHVGIENTWAVSIILSQTGSRDQNKCVHGCGSEFRIRVHMKPFYSDEPFIRNVCVSENTAAVKKNYYLSKLQIIHFREVD